QPRGARGAARARLRGLGGAGPCRRGDRGVPARLRRRAGRRVRSRRRRRGQLGKGNPGRRWPGGFPRRRPPAAPTPYPAPHAQRRPTMPDSRPLAGKTTVVTGASSGIGRAIARRFGAAGAHVTLGGRTRDAMEETARAIEKDGGAARVVELDVREPAQVRALVDGAVAATGRLDVMVNNAGVSYPGKIAEGDPEQWRAMLETNVLALLVGSQAAIRAMRACGAQGHIVNVSSIAAQRNSSGVYGATKHAVNCIHHT